MEWRKDEAHVNLDPVYDNATIYKNDVNLKPDWVQNPAWNTEFHIVREKKELLVVIGESWTYGETLPGVATGLDKYNFLSQITHGFGPRLAIALNMDLYQYAVPGNCNYYMVSSIDNILKHLKENFNYEKINLCVQLTEPGRELAIYKKLQVPYDNLYNMSLVNSFDEWLIKYDELFLDELERIRTTYNVDITVWKNFCSFNNEKLYPNLKIVKETWIQMSGKMYGLSLEAQRFQSVGWFDDFYSKFKNDISFDLEKINVELDKIEKSNAFIRGNYYHNSHPNATSHSLWAYKLYNEYTE